MKSLKIHSDLWLAYVCFFGLPLLAVGLTGACGYYVSGSLGISPWFAAPLGIVGGSLFLGAGIASSSTDMTDFAVSSIIVIVLTIILMPVLIRARDKAHRRATEQALREHSAARAHLKHKGAQRNR